MRSEESEAFKKLVDELTGSNERKDEKIADLNKIITANTQLLDILQEERTRYKKETGKKNSELSITY